MLWSLLLSGPRRRPASGRRCRPQNHGVDPHVEAITPVLVAWQGAPTKAAGEHLATLGDDFTAVLFEHLDLEECEVLPLASRYVTAAGWNQPGEHGQDSMKPNESPIMIGLVLEDADAEERARLLSNLPAPIRLLLLRTVGAWQFRAQPAPTADVMARAERT